MCCLYLDYSYLCFIRADMDPSARLPPSPGEIMQLLLYKRSGSTGEDGR